MLVLPNMGLVKWDSINDFFSHTQLAANFETLDNHDHTAGKGKQIPYGGLAEQSVGSENLRAGIATKIGQEIKIPIKWYTPKVITSEQSRENTSFATLTTADEVGGVSVTANQLVLVGYSALVKSSVSAAGRVALFFGENQLKAITTTAGTPEVQEAATVGTTMNNLFSYAGGLGTLPGGVGAGSTFVATGQTLAGGTSGGFVYVQRLAAGTYNVSVRFKATSGNISAKERSLWVGVLG